MSGQLFNLKFISKWTINWPSLLRNAWPSLVRNTWPNLVRNSHLSHQSTTVTIVWEEMVKCARPLHRYSSRNLGLHSYSKTNWLDLIKLNKPPKFTMSIKLNPFNIKTDIQLLIENQLEDLSLNTNLFLHRY